MRMSFSGLNIALSGIYTSQKVLSISSHNIANAATPGYSRQVGVITANNPINATGSGMIGTGSDLASITRVRDSYIDYRYWNEVSTRGEWDVKETAMADLGILFNESSTTGLTKVMNDFYDSIQELSKDPSSLPARVAFREKAVSLSKYFNTMAKELKELQRNYNFGVKSKVDEINSYSQQIRDLNNQIYKIELAGTGANDLRDKRQVLVDKLSKIVNIDVNEEVIGKLSNGVEDKRFTIKINGHILVNHTERYEVNYIQRTVSERNNAGDVDGLYDLQWDDGNKFHFDGGELKGYIDMRDGNGDPTSGSMNGYKGVPYYTEQLNHFARVFAQAINGGTSGSKGFEAGYGLDGSTGIKLFTANNQSSTAFTDYSTLTAENIGVSGDILPDDGIRKIPASIMFGESGNSDILLDVIKGRHDTSMFGEGAPEDYMKALIATLGVDSQEAIKMYNLQDSIVKSIENKRESISGVSIDEEMANVIMYQQIYNASAKLVSIMDEIYSVTVNNLGITGR